MMPDEHIAQSVIPFIAGRNNADRKLAAQWENEVRVLKRGDVVYTLVDIPHFAIKKGQRFMKIRNRNGGCVIDLRGKECRLNFRYLRSLTAAVAEKMMGISVPEQAVKETFDFINDPPF
jgi:hypothetical protein